MELLNNYPNNNPEDIEISIYDNLKKENNKNAQNFSEIKDMMNDVINDEESKKGFLALVRQSFLLGKLRTNIVSINFLIYFIFYFIGRRIYHWSFWEKKVREINFYKKDI